MANLDEHDRALSVEELELLPEDDDLLSFFLATAPDDPVNDFLYNPPKQVSARSTTTHARPTQKKSSKQVGNKRSIETSSSASTELEGPESPTTGENEGGTEEDRRRKRLERNRESARQSRRRKKQYLELLEGKVAQLTEEIEDARREHLDSADNTLNDLKHQLVSSLHQNLAAYPTNSQLTPGVEEEMRRGAQLIQERYGPNAEERRAVVNFHFQQLDNLLLPPYTRFLLWMSVQDESFYTKSGSSAASNKKISDSDRKDSVAKKHELWAALSTEMGLTYEQEEKIKGHYRSSNSKTAKMERRKIAMAVTYLNQLKQNLAERSQAVQSYSDSIQSILTPAQAIRYHHWASQNRARFGATLTERGLSFPNASSVDPQAKISSILHKQDQELTVEDVTTLLATLSKARRK
ncbi:hypothetical protein AC1031_019669 [Aphanomyces cochlioides]|nr:hypothetical protein AC1031_019669 [Aphanomyces cochlioides]